MRKTLLALLVGMAMVPALLANQIQLVGYNTTYPLGYQGFGPWQTGSGGEFTFHVDPSDSLSWILNAGYVNGTTKNLAGVTDKAGNPVDNTFQTFCVEVNEHISSWETLQAGVSQQSIYSGVQLTLGAAWLYHQFQIGQLAGYDYIDAGRHASAGALQAAIWYFMGQSGDPGAANNFRNLGLANGGFTVNGTGGVFIPVGVLNLWDRGAARQDMLVCLVPDGGMTALLLGIGFTALGLASRRFRK